MRLAATRKRATLIRALGLLRDVGVEQSDPQRFYSHLGEDTAGMLSALLIDAAFSGRTSCARRGRGSGNPLRGLRVLDVGGGPGFFERAFSRRGARYFSVEPDVGEMTSAGLELRRCVRGSGTQLPFSPGVFDLAYSSNVAEHVPDPGLLAQELLRVTRPGGLCVISYTIWLGPFGGHETGLWEHYLGGYFARRRYVKKHGHEPKNRFGESLFAVSCAAGMRWARQAEARGEAEVLGLFPRYHPSWAWWVAKVSVLREFLVSNLVIALRRRR
ncbi:SAM-dependent methyltransferase [Corynebacterium atypicum]|uniref:SAM-dependent methyltransferase n=1 Tax=Corynebacterium atypicum TaxID=191610 RepID=A0ABM5QPF2_9CORY|nr:class I SAM-dependent methyltransferase [Corynebacterium atypicum]AIG64804.1 SAM-dependent methyltransferase [Corynebacterium atypicum]